MWDVSESNVLIIDMDQVDIEKYPEHRTLVVDMVREKYKALKLENEMTNL